MQFDHLCKEKLTLDTIELYDEPRVLFTDILCIIAESCMPRTTAKQKKRCKPWFNTECKDAMKARKSALASFKFMQDEHAVKTNVPEFVLYSEPYSQDAGVPHGSILPVTLFSLKINSVVSCSLYVDDLAIYYSSSHMPSIERKLQQSLNRLGRWCDENGFKFSPTKTMHVHFWQLRKQHLDPQLYLNGTQILIIGEAKFLGLLFDSKLSFIPHITSLKSRCTQSLDLIKIYPILYGELIDRFYYVYTEL